MADLAIDPSQQLGQQVIDGYVANALYNADLVGSFLQASRRHPSEAGHPETISLPEDLLLELGGALRIGVWERQGLHRFLPGLPAFETAIAELESRCHKGAAAKPASGKKLLQYALETWFTRFAWSGLEELGVDVVVDDPGEAALQEVADFLWTHRGENNEQARPLELSCVE
jgi:hypothetical protein